MIEATNTAEDETLSGTYTVRCAEQPLPNPSQTPQRPPRSCFTKRCSPAIAPQWRIQNYQRDGDKQYSENFVIGTHVW